jgi:hypothetical protein
LEASIVILDIIKRFRREVSGLNEPATEQALARLGGVFDEQSNAEVIALYSDHDGSIRRPKRKGQSLPARLMPIAEALGVNPSLDAAFEGQTPGEVLWLWTDDNSNYAGVFISGLLGGFVTVVSHDEPVVAPRFLSVASFVEALLPVGEDALDLPSLRCELPVASDEGVDRGRRLGALAIELMARWRGTSSSEDEPGDEDQRRAWANAALCLLPVADTHLAVELLRDSDMWTPESAVRLLELRGHLAAIPELERLAIEGTPNGDSAAIRALVRLDTVAARQALERVARAVSPQKLAMLDMWRRVRLQPPHW